MTHSTPSHLRMSAALLCTSLAGTMASTAQAEPLQDLDALDVAVAASIGAGIGEPGGARAPIDRRLKLKACPENPIVSGPEMNAMVVSCPAIGWRVHVPLLRESAATRGRTESHETVVKRGEPLLLTVERPAFTLTRVMIADRDAKIGDVIPVREEPRGTPIFVRVVDAGKATILGR